MFITIILIFINLNKHHALSLSYVIKEPQTDSRYSHNKACWKSLQETQCLLVKWFQKCLQYFAVS